MEIKLKARAWRVNAGLTQDDVSKALQKNKGTIVMWEKGKRKPDKANLEALARLYGCKPNQILFCS